MSSPTIVVTSDNATYLDFIRELLIDTGYPQIHCGLQRSAVFDLIQKISTRCWITSKRR